MIMPQLLGNEDFFFPGSLLGGKTRGLFSSTNLINLLGLNFQTLNCSLEICGPWQNVRQVPGERAAGAHESSLPEGCSVILLNRALGHSNAGSLVLFMLV